MLAPLVLIVIACSLLGVVLLWRGRRGYAIDNHPLCAKCGFDLTGKPESSTHCPECGAELANAKSIRIGHRKLYRKTLVGGILLLLLALIGGGWIGIIQETDVDWRTYAPAWWLAYDAASSDALVRDPALNELLVRMSLQRLSDSQIDGLVDKMLDYQQDVSRTWDVLVGSIVENARTAGKVSDKQWRRYLQHAIDLRLTLRPAVSMDGPLPARIDCMRLRVAKGSPLLPIIYDLTSDAKMPGAQERIAFGHVLSAGSSFGEMTFFDLKRRQPLAQGRQIFDVGVNAIVQTRGRSSATPLDPIQLPAPLTILPSGQYSAAFTADPSLRKSVEQSISFPLGVDVARPVIEVDINKPPTGVAFDVFLRVNKREMGLGSLAVAAGKTLRLQLRNPSFLDSSNEKVVIVLRPSLAAAERSLDVFEVYNAEFVYAANAANDAHPAATPPN